MKVIRNIDGHKVAIPTTKKEKIALQKLKYDLFDNYENLDWNVGNLKDTKTAWQYMYWMYQNWYFDKEMVNPSMDWTYWGDNDTIDISYYRPVCSEYETADKIIDGKEYKYCCDTVGVWIPSNYMTLIAYYCMKGKFRKVAMLLKKYGKSSVLPGSHL